MNKYLSFDELSEFWSYSMKDSHAFKKGSRKDANEWSGGLNWEDSKALALLGWKEGLEEVEKYRARIVPKVTDKILRPQRSFSVNGYHVDVGAFLSNDPECFHSRFYEESNNPGRIFKIVCSVSFSAAIEPATIIQRGAIICALVDAMEYAGHRVEVICNLALSGSQYYRESNNRFGRFEVDVNVKSSDQPLDLSSLAFCLAHPAMLRRMMFSSAEIEGWSDYASNYGYPAKATDIGDIYIEEVFSGEIPDSKAVGWVLEKLKGLGIEFESPN